MDEAASLLVGDEPREVHFMFVLHTPDDFVTWEHDPRKDVEKHLREFTAKFNPACPVETRLAICSGHPSSEICKYAAINFCDLIVMGTHGRTGLKHLVMGSTSEQVVRHAPCPVLTFRSIEKGAA
jgi:nucleotide-binding universal stress UspA family protein